MGVRDRPRRMTVPVVDRTVRRNDPHRHLRDPGTSIEEAAKPAVLIEPEGDEFTVQTFPALWPEKRFFTAQLAPTGGGGNSDEDRRPYRRPLQPNSDRLFTTAHSPR